MKAETMGGVGTDGQRFDVMIVGEINLDLILYGLPQEMPVERELLASNFRVTLGSSSAIVAHNLAALGMKVGFVTRVGPDEFGRLALERLAESGVDLTHVQRSETSGTGVTILLPHERDRHMFTYLGTIAELTAESLPLEYLESARHFHLSSLYLQRALQPGLVELLRRLKAAGMTVSLDTNDDPDGTWGGILEEILEFVDVLLPSEGELMRMTSAESLDEALLIMGKKVPVIVAKCGARGALVYQDGSKTEVPGLSVVPVDTIGAGDSFNSGFLSAWVRGASVMEAARMGNLTGALSTQGAGGTEAFREFAAREEFLRKWRGSKGNNSGI